MREAGIAWVLVFGIASSIGVGALAGRGPWIPLLLAGALALAILRVAWRRARPL